MAAHTVLGSLSQVDLNEVNHGRMLSIPTVAKYEMARGQLLESIVTEHANVWEGIANEELRTTDQRLFLHAVTKRANAAADIDSSGSRERAPDRPHVVKGGDEGYGKSPSCVTDDDDAVLPHGTSALSFLDKMIAPFSETETVTPPPLLVLTHSDAEHELLRSQALSFLAGTLNRLASVTGFTSACRHVPVLLKMRRLAEILLEEAKNGKAQSSKDAIHAYFEAEFPSAAADTLKQAMELRSLVIVADVAEESDLLALKEAVFEELLTYRLLIVAPAHLLLKDEVDNSILPPAFFER